MHLLKHQTELLPVFIEVNQCQNVPEQRETINSTAGPNLSKINWTCQLQRS